MHSLEKQGQRLFLEEGCFERQRPVCFLSRSLSCRSAQTGDVSDEGCFSTTTFPKKSQQLSRLELQGDLLKD